MYKTTYRTVWRQQEVEFKDMDWDAFISDTFNYLCGFSGQGSIEADQEFVLRSGAEKYVKEHPINITRLQDYFLIRWLELYEIVFNEDDCEAGYDLLGFGDLVIISKFNLMDVPIVSNFDLVGALNKLDEDQIEKLISPL